MESPADEVFYGGAAGGGKTDLLIGLSVAQHRASIIFRREYPQLKGIYSRSREIIGSSGRLNEQSHIWRLDGRTVEFGAVKDEADKENYQGQPHDLIGFDEITHFTESQVRFIIGWNRTTVPGQRCRVIYTGNPPSTTEGQWIIGYFAPWLDETHHHPAQPGELRWFVVVQGKDIEVDSPEPIVMNGEKLYPKSRTFIPARLGDNPFLSHDTNYLAVLQGMQEPMRTQLIYGDFRAGLVKDSYQLISSEALQEAKNRTRSESRGKVIVGVDAAGPGDDETTATAMRQTTIVDSGAWVDSDPRGPLMAFLLQFAHEDLEVRVDEAGIGYFLMQHIRDNLPKAKVIGVNVGAAPSTDEAKTKYSNLKAELYWHLRTLFTEGEIAGLTDQVTLSQLASIRYKHDEKGRVAIEKKEDARKRGVKSPDRGEGVLLAAAPSASLPNSDEDIGAAFAAASTSNEIDEDTLARLQHTYGEGVILPSQITGGGSIWE